jgi:large subunit ribosomal protein L1
MDLNKIVNAVTEAQTKAPKRKFEESMELIVNLKGIDMKKGGKQINVDITLPHPVGGTAVQVCVIGSATFVFQARKAGAAHVLGPEDLSHLETDKEAVKALADKMGFFVAQADMMPLIGRVLGPVLGPRGKMPRPVPADADIAKLLSEFSSSVKLRMRKNLVIQNKIGQRKMEPKRVAENIQAVLTALERNLDKGASNIGEVLVKTTMGPTVKIEA